MADKSEDLEVIGKNLETSKGLIIVKTQKFLQSSFAKTFLAWRVQHCRKPCIVVTNSIELDHQFEIYLANLQTVSVPELGVEEVGHRMRSWRLLEI